MTSMRREYGNEVFGQDTEAAQRPALQAAPSRRHKMHSVTWVVTAIGIAVLSWDSWQTVQEVRQSRALHHPYVAASAGHCGIANKTCTVRLRRILRSAAWRKGVTLSQMDQLGGEPIKGRSSCGTRTTCPRSAWT